jgi:hypothetical protein
LSQPVPDLGGRIGTPPGEESAIGAECETFHAPGIVAQGILWIPILRISEPDAPVYAARGQELTIRAERHAGGGMARVRALEGFLYGANHTAMKVSVRGSQS